MQVPLKPKHSLMDWIALKKRRGPALSGKDKRTETGKITKAELQKHRVHSSSSCCLLLVACCCYHLSIPLEPATQKRISTCPPAIPPPSNRTLPILCVIFDSLLLLPLLQSVDTGVWTVLQGRVYNITPYLDYHPGGAKILMQVAVSPACASNGRRIGRIMVTEIHKIRRGSPIFWLHSFYSFPSPSFLPSLLHTFFLQLLCRPGA